LNYYHRFNKKFDRTQLLAHPFPVASAFLYPAPKSTKDKNPQAIPRVGTGTCDGKSRKKNEPIFMSLNYLIRPANNFSNKNQKEKEEFFIFLMKKPRFLYDKN
jgi:hypothetical protein